MWLLRRVLRSYGPNRPTRSGSSCRRTAHRSTASRGRNTRLRTYLTPPSTEPFPQPFAGAQNSAQNGYAPRNAANATGATQRRGHEENWEFETYRILTCRCDMTLVGRGRSAD